MITQHVKPPIVITVPAPRRRVPTALLIFVLSVALVALSRALEGDGAAVLAAVGCAGILASIYRPTRVAASERVYTVFGIRMHGDEETDKIFDEGR